MKNLLEKIKKLVIFWLRPKRNVNNRHITKNYYIRIFYHGSITQYEVLTLNEAMIFIAELNNKKLPLDMSRVEVIEIHTGKRVKRFSHLHDKLVEN